MTKNNIKIAIIAPSSACPREDLLAGAAWLLKNKFDVQFDLNILNPYLYLAQSDEYKIKILKDYLKDPEIDVIWCLRGGYGSLRLWPELLKLKKPKKQKLLIGLSDITSLHQFFNQKWNWPTLHASLLDRLGKGTVPQRDQKELLQIIRQWSESFGLVSSSKKRNEKNAVTFNKLKPLNLSAQKTQTLKGRVLGGNLATYMSSFGTHLEPNFKLQFVGASEKVILFFEDIGERGYKVDRFLQQLKQTRNFHQVGAVVFGDFTGGDEPDGKNLIQETVRNWAQELKIPILKGIEAGHGLRQRPLFFNTKAVLTCGVKPSMVVLSL